MEESAVLGLGGRRGKQGNLLHFPAYPRGWGPGGLQVTRYCYLILSGAGDTTASSSNFLIPSHQRSYRARQVLRCSPSEPEQILHFTINYRGQPAGWWNATVRSNVFRPNEKIGEAEIRGREEE